MAEVLWVENFNVQCRSCERVFESTVAVPRFGKPVFGEMMHSCRWCGFASGYASWEHFRLAKPSAIGVERLTMRPNGGEERLALGQ
ncbi:MAG: hypothetical protein HY556_11820 [Euryarchaeota archaeon]|nr:hypothetical protein [Euryarchaeota archaeon]